MYKALCFIAALFVVCVGGAYLLQLEGEPARLEYTPVVVVESTPVFIPPDEDMVRELFVLMDMQNAATNISDAMAEQIRTQVPGMAREIVEENIFMTEEDLDHYMQLVLPDYMEKFFDEIIAVIEPEKMVEEIYLPLYMQSFDAGEIRDMIRFYESPTGMKMVALSPQITATSLAMMMDLYGEQITSRVNQISQKMVVDIEQRMWDDMFSKFNKKVKK